MARNSLITVSTLGFSCFLFVIALTMTGMTSAQPSVREHLPAALPQPASAADRSPGGLAGSNDVCEPTWWTFDSGGPNGVNDTVYAQTVWNGDLVVGGEFTTAGGVTVNGIARWDGSQWHPFESGGQIGVNNTVRSLAVWNGDLVVGGPFTEAGGQTVNRIARWDGSQWHPFTSGGQTGFQLSALSLAVWQGDLIAGGGFTEAGGQTVNGIARWDGSQWHPFTSGGQTGLAGSGSGFLTVTDLTVWNGFLVAGGEFNAAGGQAVNNIARWDGSQWHPFESGGQTGVSSSVWALTVWNGDLIAGGGFNTAGGQTVNRIARWDGAQWHTLTSCGQAPGVTNQVEALTVWNGFLVAGGGFFGAGGQTVNDIARWNGSQWQPFISGGQTGVDGLSFMSVLSLAVWNGNLIAGGGFTEAGGQTVNHIAGWDGCLTPDGACCINGVALGAPISEADCLAVGGVYQGDFTDPVQVTCPQPEPTCPGDLNGDGVVDVFDLLIVLDNWGTCEVDDTTPAEGCGAPDTGSCFESNGTPYCSDAACCKAVCACDPFCCETEWDSLCAGDGINDGGCGAAVLCTP